MSDIEEQIKKGESQTLEFKRSLSLRKKGLESLCAIVNADEANGAVVFGINDDGSVCGIEPGNHDAAQRTLVEGVRHNFQPPLIVQSYIRQFEGKPVLVLTGERLSTVPYHEYDGRAWIREGTTNRQLSLAEKDHLMSRRNRDYHSGPWKCDKCGTWYGQLSNVELTGKGMKKTYKCRCGGEFWPA